MGRAVIWLNGICALNPIHRAIAMSETAPSSQVELLDTTVAASLGQAFNEAWQALLKSGLHRFSSMSDDDLKEILACRIIELANKGERDPARLRDDALSYLAERGLRT
jgi:hypothetical protein